MRKEVLFDKSTAKFGNNCFGRKAAFRRLAFKPDTGDTREALSHILIDGPWARGITVTVFGRPAPYETQDICGNGPRSKLVSSPMATLGGAGAPPVVAERKGLREPDFGTIKTKSKKPATFNGCDPHKSKTVSNHGIQYWGIGR